MISQIMQAMKSSMQGPPILINGIAVVEKICAFFVIVGLIRFLYHENQKRQSSHAVKRATDLVSPSLVGYFHHKWKDGLVRDLQTHTVSLRSSVHDANDFLNVFSARVSQEQYSLVDALQLLENDVMKVRDELQLRQHKIEQDLETISQQTIEAKAGLEQAQQEHHNLNHSWTSLQGNIDALRDKINKVHSRLQRVAAAVSDEELQFKSSHIFIGLRDELTSKEIELRDRTDEMIALGAHWLDQENEFLQRILHLEGNMNAETSTINHLLHTAELSDDILLKDYIFKRIEPNAFRLAIQRHVGVEYDQLSQRVAGSIFTNGLGEQVMAPAPRASTYFSQYHLFVAIIEAHQKIEAQLDPRGELIVEHNFLMGPIVRANIHTPTGQQTFRSHVRFDSDRDGNKKICHIYPAGDDHWGSVI